MAMTPPLETDLVSRRTATRIAFAGFFGTVIEYFEFLSYGYLAVIIAPLFFPAENKSLSILSAFLVFATGYFVRPLGGLFFGRLGDKRGRRTALMVTVLVMGLSSVALGLLPTYAAVGVLAPILLIVVRLVQGFSAGGEIIGSVTYLAEAAPKKYSGLFSAITPAGSTVGVGLAALTAAIVTSTTSPQQMTEWGWRIPFLLCLPLMVVTILIRLKLEDSPEFKLLVENSAIEKTPIRTVLRSYKKPVLQVLAVAMVINIVGGVGSTYITTALIANAGFPAGQVYFVTAGAAIVSFAAMIGSGLLSQRIGRRRTLLASLILLGVYAIPAFIILRDTKSILVVLIALAIWNLFANAQSPPSFGTFAAIFPPAIRYTGAALGFNIGVVLGGGLSPYFSQLMLTTTGDQASPAYLVAAACVVGVIVVLTLPKGTKAEDEAATAALLQETAASPANEAMRRQLDTP
ncbi:MFS transporter [Microbacterium sp. SLBN-111]|uniref:MFS transporter n=1 Tax=Microbacterium sp. SLBN-111 TaxID=3377733 RepID=UPI003C72B61E